MISGKKRSFHAEWFDKWPWLHWNSKDNNVKCHICCSAKIRGVLTFSKNADGAFIESGFCNWKKASEVFSHHEKSQTHCEAVMKYKSFIHNENVAARLQQEHAANQERSHQALLKIAQSIKFLARQGLALLGHDTSSGNLHELLHLRSQDIPDLANWLSKRTTWTSRDIQNEFLTIMAKDVLRGIAAEIQSAKWYAVIVDETTDIGVKEQVSLCIRHVDENFVVNENFVGFYETAETDSMTLVKIISDVLCRLSLPIDDCRGQCYDGASNMSGRLSGV